MKVVVVYNLSERLLCGERGEATAEESVIQEMEAVSKALDELGYEHREIAISDSMDMASVFSLLRDLNCDVVFNLVESLRGNSALEAAFAASLELLNIPFTGSGSIALTLCHNKGTAKAILRSNGIKTPRYCIFGLGDNNFCLNNFPVIVKPLHEDGSLGITAESVVRNNSELWDRVINIRKNYGQEALVEEYIEGREFGIGVISFNGSNRAFPVSEIVFDGYPEDLPRIVSFNAKWNEDVPEYKKSVPHCPADISWNLSRRLKNTGLKVFKVFGLRGYCRIDVRVRNNKIYVLDVNGNPDIAPGSGVHTILNASKVSYTEFIQQLIEGALRGK